MLEALDWQGPVYAISAISGKGTDVLCADLMTFIEGRKAAEAEDAELAEAERELQERMQSEARERIELLRRQYRAQRAGEDDEDEDLDDDDSDVEVEYRP